MCVYVCVCVMYKTNVHFESLLKCAVSQCATGTSSKISDYSIQALGSLYWQKQSGHSAIFYLPCASLPSSLLIGRSGLHDPDCLEGRGNVAC